MEILFAKEPDRCEPVSGDIRWLKPDEMSVFNEHLALCGQKTVSAEIWQRIQEEGTRYCGLFTGGKMTARACIEKIDGMKWEVSDVRVVRAYRNQGQAKSVCRFVMNEIFGNGKIASIRTEEDNFPMLAVIRALGFKPVNGEGVKILIRPAKEEEAYLAARLADRLWDADPDREAEMAQIIRAEDSDILLAFHGEQAVGFAQVGLRYDYVEGREGDGPVGYLEGVYVEEAFRRLDIARSLVKAAETWAWVRNCRQLASDCELHNEDSIRFHLGSGFEEAGRIVCFIKNL